MTTRLPYPTNQPAKVLSKEYIASVRPGGDQAFGMSHYASQAVCDSHEELRRQLDEAKHLLECANTPLMRDIIAERDAALTRLAEANEILHEFTSFAEKPGERTLHDLRMLGDRVRAYFASEHSAPSSEHLGRGSEHSNKSRAGIQAAKEADCKSVTPETSGVRVPPCPPRDATNYCHGCACDVPLRHGWHEEPTNIPGKVYAYPCAGRADGDGGA